MSRIFSLSQPEHSNKFLLLDRLCPECNREEGDHNSQSMGCESNNDANNCQFNDEVTVNKQSLNQSQTIYRLAPSPSTLGPEQTNPQSKSASQLDIKFKRRGIHFCNLNIRHLKPKIDEMKLLLYSSKSIDVFGVCETFLNTTVDNISIHIDGYKIERKRQIWQQPKCLRQRRGSPLLCRWSY